MILVKLHRLIRHTTYFIYSICLSVLMLLSSGLALGGDKGAHKHLTQQLKDSLKTEIERMLSEDQKYRWMLEYAEVDDKKIDSIKKLDDSCRLRVIYDVQKHHKFLPLRIVDSIEKLQEKIDSINLKKLSGIIKTYGFPHKYVPIYYGIIILNHVDVGLVTDEFIELLRQEVRCGNLTPIEFANFYDRLQLGKKLPELYYVLEHYNPITQKTELHTPKDIDATNKARADIGLKKIKR